jgi:hypothetical protein
MWTPYNVHVFIHTCPNATEVKGADTEAKGCREMTQRGVLPYQAGGEGWKSDGLHSHSWTPYPNKELLSCELLALPAAAAVASKQYY